VKGSLKQALKSTNPCESMIEIVRRTSSNEKRWQSGDMCLRWTAAKKWFDVLGGADVRVDAVVVQGNVVDSDSSTAYAPSTFRFPGIGDGDAVPTDE
jgi:hypothetical protein